MNEPLLTKTTVATTRGAAVMATDRASPRPIVVVIGMHRSGTSLCAHVLSCLGVDMADETAVNSGNAKGHWERLELMALHDRMLGLCNRGYFTPLHDLALPAAWWADPQIQAVKREIVEFLQRRIGVMPFGFKDPRTARLMPVWSQIFAELNLAPKFVLCLRNPAQVARSLRDRDHLDPQTGEYRWFVYLTDIVQFIGKHEFCLVEYEDWFSEPERNTEKLRQFLEIDWPGSETGLRLAVSEIVDGELRHDDPRHAQAREPTIRWFYDLMRDFPGDSAARQRAHHLVTQFAAYRQLHRPFDRAFENAIALADKVAPLEQEIAALRLSVEERDAELVGMRAAATDLRADLARVHAELAAREAALAEAEQRAAEQAAAAGEAQADLARLEAELATRQAALAEAEQRAAEQAAAAGEAQADLARVEAELATDAAALAEAEQRAAEQAAAAGEAQADLARVEAELAAAETALAEAEQRAAEQAAAAGDAGAALARMEAELATGAAALAEAEQRAAEQAAAAGDARADLAQLRTELATGAATIGEARWQNRELAAEIALLRGELERAAQEKSTAAAAAQAEIEALRNDLTVARQTAAAALAALRTDFAAPANGSGGIGQGRRLWRRSRAARPQATR